MIENDTQLQNLLTQTKDSFNSQVNPYLKTRIFSELEKQNKRTFSFLRNPFINFLEGAVLASLILFSYQNIKPSNNNIFNGFIGQNYSINIQISKLKSQHVGWIKINLPEGLSLYSKENSNISTKKTLMIPFESIKSFENLPIVFNSNKKGGSTIKISFYNVNKKFMRTKDISLFFKKQNILTF